jgi:hypothetical protein
MNQSASFRRTWLTALTAAAAFLSAPALAGNFSFSTGNPDGLMAAASRPSAGAAVEIETADDFILTNTTVITSATFTGLLPENTIVSEVQVELYHIFPADSTQPPSGHSPTRNNSPADVAFESRDSTAGELSFTIDILNSTFTAQNSVLNGIHAFPNQTTHGEGAVTGVEVRFNVTFNHPFVLAPGHYFFKPSATSFFWLSAPKPIVAPGTPFLGDLQAWIRNEDLAPDWLRIGTDIIGGTPAPTFNMTFTLSGHDVTLDIHPGSCPNPINARSRGVTPVALAGDVGIDFSRIDLSSLRLSRADGVGGSVAPLEGPPGPHTEFGDATAPKGSSGCPCELSAPDGIEDLLMYFSTRDLVSALQLGSASGGQSFDLVITASLNDGTPFRSDTDCIVIVPH